MAFFDYFFYRFYLFYLKREGKATCRFSAVCLASAMMVFSSGIFWGPIAHFFYHDILHWMHEYVILVTIVCLSLANFYYKKKQDLLLERYKESKWNNRIPDWSLLIICFLFCFVCMLVSAIIIQTINHLWNVEGA